MNQAKISLLYSSIIFVIGVLFFGAAAVHLGQDINWDLKNYHYYNAFAFVNGRLGFDFAPAQHQTYLNPIIDLPFYYFVNHLDPVWVGFLMGGIQGINFGLVFAISYFSLVKLRPILRYALAIICASVGLCGPAGVSELGTTLGDNVVSLFVLSSILVIIRIIIHRPFFSELATSQGIAAAAVLLGIGGGLKLTQMIYGVGACLALLLSECKWKNALVNIGIWGACFIGGIMVSLAFWMFDLWEKFNSPLFPFYNKFFKSPYFELINLRDVRFFPKNVVQELFYPFYMATYQHMVSEVPFRDVRYAIIYSLLLLATVIAIFKWAYKRTSHYNDNEARSYDSQYNIFKFLVIFFVSSYIAWQAMFSIYRYSIVLEFLSPIVIILLVDYIVPNRKMMVAISLGLFVLIILTLRPLDWGRTSWSNTFFGVQTPAIDDPEQSIIIMTGYDPTAYVIPFFPTTVRFVRVESNFTNPNAKNKMQVSIRQLLSLHKGPIYLLHVEGNSDAEITALESYGLTVNLNECKAIVSRLDQGLNICAVERK